MKKILLLSLFLVFLVSCGKKEVKEEPKENIKVEINTETKEDKASDTEGVEINDEISVKVDGENATIKAGDVEVNSKDGTIKAPGVEIDTNVKSK